MTTAKLNGLYDQLTADERAQLLFSAFARNDESEVQRLNSTAPRESWRLPHHTKAFRAISLLALQHRMEQLGDSAAFLCNWAQLEGCEDAKNSFWETNVACSAYTWFVRDEAWLSFCDEMGWQSDDLLHGMPGDLVLITCRRLIPNRAPSREELLALLEKSENYRDVNDTNLLTVDDQVQKWRSLYEQAMS